MKTIIIDNLEWQLDDDGIKRNWKDSVIYATTLRYGWRLPTIEELISIVDYNTHSPACKIDSCRSSFYWSGTPYDHYRDYAWNVNFGYGYVLNYFKDYHYYVRCVRPVAEES